MNCILHVYIRLFTNVPSADNNNVWPEGCSSNEEVLKKIEDAKNYSLTEKKTFLKALGEYDRKREPCDKTKLRDYRLWQAVWASKYDKSGARIPEASDSYIIFPRR